MSPTEKGTAGGGGVHLLSEPRGGARGERRGRGSCARGEDRAAGRVEWGPGGRGARGRRWEAGAVPLRRRSRKEAGSGSLPAQVSRPRVTGGGTSRSWRRGGGGCPLPLRCRGPQGRGIQSRPCQFLRAGLGLRPRSGKRGGLGVAQRAQAGDGVDSCGLPSPAPRKCGDPPPSASI